MFPETPCVKYGRHSSVYPFLAKNSVPSGRSGWARQSLDPRDTRRMVPSFVRMCKPWKGLNRPRSGRIGRGQTTCRVRTPSARSPRIHPRYGVSHDSAGTNEPAWGCSRPGPFTIPRADAMSHVHVNAPSVLPWSGLRMESQRPVSVPRRSEVSTDRFYPACLTSLRYVKSASAVLTGLRLGSTSWSSILAGACRAGSVQDRPRGEGVCCRGCRGKEGRGSEDRGRRRLPLLSVLVKAEP